MSNFLARTITGLSMAFLIVAALVFSRYLFSVIFLAVTILGLIEFYRMTSRGGIHPQMVYGTAAGGAIYIALALIGYLGNLLYFFYALIVPLPFFFLPFILEIYRKKENPLANIAVTIMGIVYVALPLSLLNLLYFRQPVHGLELPLYLTGYIILTWAFDTAAYLYGKSFGRHRFFERISPRKTWEGIAAGALTILIITMVMAWLAPVIPVTDWFVLAILVLVFGTFGDLAESLIKRSLDLKDSGSILPGHGGILDRFDTILISAPFVFLHFLIRILIL